MGAVLSGVMILWAPASHAQFGVSVDPKTPEAMLRQATFTIELFIVIQRHCNLPHPQTPVHADLCTKLQALFSAIPPVEKGE